MLSFQISYYPYFCCCFILTRSKIFTVFFYCFMQLLLIKWATSWENLFMPYANTKGADQPARLRSLISTFVVRCLDTIIHLLAIADFKTLASLCSWADRFESYLVGNLEDRFSRDEAQIRQHFWRPILIIRYSNLVKVQIYIFTKFKSLKW